MTPCARVVAFAVLASACTQRIELTPVAASSAGDGGFPSAADAQPAPGVDAATPPDAAGAAQIRIPTPVELQQVVDALPRQRRAGDDEHRATVDAWRQRLRQHADAVHRHPCPLVRWTPDAVTLRVQSGTVSVALAAEPSEASGAADLRNAEWVMSDAPSDQYAGKVVVVPSSVDSDLMLRVREYPNVRGQTVAAAFDTYWRLAEAGALGAIFVLPDSVPPSAAAAFPSVPDLTSRMPAAFVRAAAFDEVVEADTTFEWRTAPTATATQADGLIARLPGPDGAPTVAMIAALDSPRGHRSFDASLAAAWGTLSALSSIPVAQRPVELVLVHPASHWYEPGFCVERIVEETVLEAFAGVDVVVDLFAPAGIDRAVGSAAPRIAWRPQANDLLELWLEGWPTQLSLRTTTPPSDIAGIERRFANAPRVVISAAYDHRYFRENASLPFPAEDVHTLIADLIEWLHRAPILRAPRPSAAGPSSRLRLPVEPMLPGLPPAPTELAARAATSTAGVDAVVLAIGGFEAPAAVVYDGGAPVTWLGYLSSRGRLAAYAVDITGSGESTRPAVLAPPSNWEAPDGQVSQDATHPFLLHSADSVIADIDTALDWLAERHPGRPVHLTAQGLMGGYALWAARSRPERVASVLAWATPGLFVFPERPGRLPAAGRPARLLTRASLRSRWGPMVQRLDQIDEGALDAAWRDLLATETPEVRTREVVRLPTVANYGLTRALVRSVNVPVLLAYGEFDRDAPSFLVRGLYDALTDSPRRWMIEVQGVSHFASWEREGRRLFELHRRWIVEGDALNRPQGVGTFDGVTISWEPD